MSVSALPDDCAKAPCAPVSPLNLMVDGEPDPRMVAETAARGFRLVAAERGMAGAVSLGTATDEAIAAGLAWPGSGFLELGAQGLGGIGEDCFQAAREGGLSLSLTTRSAFSRNLLDIMIATLRTRTTAEGQELLDLVEICLGEAISNAVMHGNLEVPGFLRVDAKGFALFRQVMQERLDDPGMAARRVEITVRFLANRGLAIRVSDQGKGFDLASQLERNIEAEAKSGRGLALIRQLCTQLGAENQGRTVVMTFV